MNVIRISVAMPALLGTICVIGISLFAAAVHASGDPSLDDLSAPTGGMKSTTNCRVE